MQPQNVGETILTRNPMDLYDLSYIWTKVFESHCRNAIGLYTIETCPYSLSQMTIWW